MRIAVRGVVQGVGFRPFIYRLAMEMGLTGWVLNSSEGVTIEVEGIESILNKFLAAIKTEKPSNSWIETLNKEILKPTGFTNFQIRQSEDSAEKTTLVLPDIATCPECLEEIFNPTDRRHLYPFTNCTYCGPRYSIIEGLPYDRKNTSMKIFPMCPKCQSEYENPLDRRFHAQPNACPTCGPQLELWNDQGQVLASKHEALLKTAKAIKEGKIVAIKGLGGFHLFADAQNEHSVNTLRKRKHREEKPLALMFPSLKMVEAYCEVSEEEKRLLLSRERPIVLLKRKSQKLLVNSIAPSNPFLGVILPYTPLHHLLMAEIKSPLVATSGNLSEEPICTDENEALKRLAGIADIFLVHNRPIVRHVDDSIVRLLMGRPYVLRRARGYAPLPVTLKKEIPCILAVGGHQKNTLAISIKNHVFLSQHIGDLETEQSLQAFKATEKSFQELYQPTITHVARDKHPEYLSSKFASEIPLPTTEVQHHHAHIVSCMAENHLDGTVLGISWDGTGWGTDHTIWGGEFLLTTLANFSRVGHLKPFPLPGGEKAIKEPRRAAVGLLKETFGPHWLNNTDLPSLKAFDTSELPLLDKVMKKKLNCPMTSSMGRLFDAIASLLDICHCARFEGQAAMSLEFAIEQIDTRNRYSFEIIPVSENQKSYVIDWRPMVKDIIHDIRAKTSSAIISAKFHHTLIEMAVEIAKQMEIERVVLSGGCFQNLYLTEGLIRRLKEEGFSPFWHQKIPCNDGGISLGQAVVAANNLNSKS